MLTVAQSVVYQRSRLATRGSALLITLAFVLLLSVVILAFLSHSLLEQQISTSNANQTKADIFAQGTAATIIGDLQGEIQSAANSTKVPLAVGNLYLPKIPANNVPIYDLNGGAGGAALTANLLKVSNKAAVGTMPVASGIATTVASLNNRAVSVNQWYGAAGPQLVDPTAAPATPQWVLVGRDGTNPPFAAAGAAKSTAYSPITPQSNTTVTGRYAYAIYDEGGLIDVNAAGKPSNLATNYGSYPIGEGDADLAQLNSATLPALTPQQIDQIIAYRNYASVQNTPYPGAANGAGGFTAGTVKYPKALPAINALSYFFYVLGNPLGFLNTSNAALAGTASDQRFTNRQQLIQFFTSLTAGTGNTGLLQYLTHFSRDLDQPSYAPAAGAPTVIANSGGNNASGFEGLINPSILQVRVAAAFTRNDGSPAKVGDPLVKSRFNLNRLAWITYKGPLSDGHLGAAIAKTAGDINSTDPDLKTMAGYLHDNYGFSWAFLQQGTADNVYNYFGLSWVHDIRVTPTNFFSGDNQLKWFYNHQQATKYLTLPFKAGQIFHLTDVNGSGATTHEPDFFELLQAAIACGSKAKPATLYVMGAAPGSAQFVENFYNLLDSTLSDAIVQIGVNVIDQFKLDGYPSRILFNDGAYNEFHGTESLPYVYAVRYAEIQAAQPVVLFQGSPSYTKGVIPPGHVAQPVYQNSPYIVGGTISTTASSTSVPLSGGTGAYVSLIIPEVWNPTDQNSPRCALNGDAPLQDSNNTNLFPTSFRLVAESTYPRNIISSTGNSGPSYSGNVQTNYPKSTDLNLGSYDMNKTSGSVYSPYANATAPNNCADPTGYVNLNGAYDPPAPQASLLFLPDQPPGMGVFTKITDFNNPPSFSFTAESTAMVFNDNGAAANLALPSYFYEPTLLANPGIPAGLTISGQENILNNATVTFGATSSIPGTGPNMQNLIKVAGLKNRVPSTQPNGASFIGIYANVMPLLWYGQANDISKSTTTTVSPAVFPNAYFISQAGNFRPNTPAITFRMQYEYPVGSGIWRTYDEKYTNVGDYGSPGFQRTIRMDGTISSALLFPYLQPTNDPYNYTAYPVAYDPRTSRFGMVSYNANYGAVGNPKPNIPIPSPNQLATATTPVNSWVSGASNTVFSLSSGLTTAATDYVAGANSVATHYAQAAGWTGGAKITQIGYFSQNLVANGVYYADPDGIVRRASGAAANATTGLPMAILSTQATQTQSRPIMLHRPFRSVGELGYVFSGTPWKNLDFENSESGDSPLLDVFTVGDPTGSTAIVAGKVNLNTQQIPVLQAILAGNYKDEQTNYTTAPGGSLAALTAAEANNIAKDLTARTLSSNATVGKGPLQNVSELVGRYVNTAANGNNQPYAGFSDDITAGLLTANPIPSVAIQRFKESAIRGLAAAGQTRIWNLMIDLVAQTGRYPVSAATADQFNVEGQQRYWIHLAIDRLTGQIIDKQVELIRE